MNYREVKKFNYACIYRIKFPNGKWYVGRTVNLRDRVELYEKCLTSFKKKSTNPVMEAMERFGIESVEWDVLASPSGLSKSDLDITLSILEIKYIRESDCLEPKGYNVSIGGELLGIPVSVIDTNFGVTTGGQGCHPVLVYDKVGNFMTEYPSTARCAYMLDVSVNALKDALKRRGLLCGMYMVREKMYDMIPEKIPPYVPDVKIKNRILYKDEVVYRERVHNNAVIAYDREGNYVGIFDNVRKSRHYLEISDTKLPFGRLVRGVYLLHYNGGEIKKSLGGFTSTTLKTVYYSDVLALGDIDNIGESISMKLEDLPEKGVKGMKRMKGMKNMLREPERAEKPKVNKYTLLGEFVESYRSVSDAARANNVFGTAIRACAIGKVRRCGDYVYRYEGSTLPIPTFSQVTIDERGNKSASI